MRRRYLKLLIVMNLLTGFFSASASYAFERDGDIDSYHQNHGGDNDWTGYFLNSEDNINDVSYRDDSRATENDELSPVLIDVLKAHLLLDPSAMANTPFHQTGPHELIRVNIFPVISSETASKQFVLAMPGSTKTRLHPKPSDPYALTKDLYNVRFVAVSGSFQLKTLDGAELDRGQDLSFKKTKEGFDYVLDGKRNKFEGLALITDPEQLTHVEWATTAGNQTFDYYGNFLITKEMTPTNEDAVKVVNFIEIERYVREVVPGEMSAKFHMESLEAQAIAARTYAFNKINEFRGHRNFDVTASTQDQIYVGASRELHDSKSVASAIQAAHNTEGKILVYNNHIIKALFSENNAGRVVAYKDWDPKHLDYPYLTTAEDPGKNLLLALKSGTYKLHVDPIKFAKTIRNVGINFPDNEVLSSIPMEPNGSGRPTTILAIGKSSLATIKGDNFLKVVKGANLRVFMEPGHSDANGVSMIAHGSGPGVGLCQEGANILATRYHYNYQKILNFYYPGAKIVNFDPSYLPTPDPINL